MYEVNKTFLFVDESGDPTFYSSGNRSVINTEDFNPVLLIGMVKLTDRKVVRNSILQFMNELKNDPLYNSLPCFTRQKDWFLHASYDNLEVRIKFAEFLRSLEGFEFHCIIGRKRSDIFHKKHNRNESEFYFDLLYHLIQGQLSDDSKHKTEIKTGNR